MMHLPSTPKSSAPPWYYDETQQTFLWDVAADPQQAKPLRDAAVERRMVEHLRREMSACGAPAEQFERLGVEG